MKKFISNLLFFCFLVLLLFAALVLFTHNITSVNVSVKSNNKVQSIVMGNSHPECAFNDSLINSFKNYGQSAESYFYTYFKLKKIVENNPSVKNVFLELNDVVLKNDADQWIWGDKQSQRYSNLFPIIDIKDQTVLAKNNFKGFINFVTVATKENFLNTIYKDFDYSDKMGGYLNLAGTKSDSALKMQPKESIFADPKDNISTYNIIYLKKISEYCKSKNVNLFLIRSPLNNNYTGFEYEEIFNEIRNANFINIEFLDFSKFKLNNSDFWDPGHLNSEGAKKFSIWFNKIQEAGLVNKKNKQQFINDNFF